MDIIKNFSHDGLFLCESLDQDAQFLVMRVILPQDYPLKGVLEVQIPPQHVSYIVCGTQKQIPGKDDSKKQRESR